MKANQIKKQSTVLDSKPILYFLSDIKKNQIDFKIDKNSTLIFLSNDKNNINKNIKFNIKKNCVLKVYFIDLIQNSNHYFNIIFNNEFNCKSYFFAKLFASENGNSFIDIKSNVKKNHFNVTTEQEIKGFLFSNNAKITAIPSLIIDTNKINAAHSVNIGYVNKDFIFYLETKGFNYKQAINTIIENEISILKDTYYNSKKHRINAYQQAKLTINKMLNNRKKYDR